jgi:5-methyltetrahydrofolate--homocysteine methyltransferase
MKLPFRREPWDPAREPLVSDGAWGTELQRLGLPLGAMPDAWNLTEPALVASVARAYVEAGAVVVETNTFGSTRINLLRHGLEGKVRELNRRGAELTARETRGRALTAGSIGPCGRLLASGEVGEQELTDAFAEQAASLRDGGAEWIVVESMIDAREMRIAVRAAREASGLPVAASMTYDPAGRSFRTMMGDTVEACVRLAVEAGAVIVGSNCGHGIQTFAPLVREIARATSLPVWVYANAGLPRVVDGRAVYDADPEAYAAAALELVEAGASIVGGCCGTTPAFIAAIGRRLELRRSAR